MFRTGWLVLGSLALIGLWSLVQRRRSGADVAMMENSLEDLIIMEDHREKEAHGVLNPAPQSLGERKGRFGYVSLICDDSGIAQARVLAYSWRRVRSAYPLLFLALPFVTTGETTATNRRPASLQELTALGAEVVRVEMLPTEPFRRANGRRPAFEKLCKYSKIHAWAQTQFERAVYLEGTMLLFPQFSAVKVAGDEFNTGLFVFEPNAQTYQEMLMTYLTAPKHMLGEQGFLNWFFHNRPTNVISARYNTVDYAVWPLLRRSAKVFHFTRHTAPWNFFLYGGHAEWEQHFEPTVFYYWMQMQQQAFQSLQIEEHNPFSLWANYKRASDICNPFTTLYNPKRFAITNKFSVLIGTWDRISLLRRLVLHYQKSRLVHKIYITWHNPAIRPPEDFLRSVRKRPPVEILTQKYDSLNNRFNPIATLETKAVLVCDDDIRVNLVDLEYAFEVWKLRPHSLVGVFPRYHQYHPENGTWTYQIRSPDRPRQYSLMLTKLMFMQADYLFAYTCLLPTRIHQYIDGAVNCEDIAMNLMVSGMTGARPVAVLMHVDDFGTTSGISLKAGHLGSRSQCLTDLIRLFGRDTLRYNREVFLPFRRKKNNTTNT